MFDVFFFASMTPSSRSWGLRRTRGSSMVSQGVHLIKTSSQSFVIVYLRGNKCV